jgi:hypothetical protein
MEWVFIKWFIAGIIFVGVGTIVGMFLLGTEDCDL